MRSSKSRSRSKTNRPRSLGNIVNRVFDSSGPEGKVRGTPAQLIEKYQFLARDAQLGNDRVAAENFLQHAEHYTRMLAEAMREMAAEQENRQQYHQPGGNQNGQNGGQGYQSNQNQQRDRQQGQGDRRDDRSDYRPEYRSDYRDPAADDQPAVGSHLLIDDSDGDAGLVETPEAAPRPQRQDEPRRNDGHNNRQNDGQNNRSSNPQNPPRGDNQRGDNQRNDNQRSDRPREEQRRPYPPRVDQQRVERQERAADQPPVAAPAPAPVMSPTSPMMPIFEAPAETAPTAAPKPRAPRTRAPKKPVDAEAPASGSQDPAAE